MPPSGPRSSAIREHTSPTSAATSHHPPFKGPNPGKITVSNQYALEHNIRRSQKEHGCDPAREDSYRLQGVHLIDTVRIALHLPVKTLTTACTYYHMFRLCHRDLEYNYQDASLACLFVACKVEDTIKKSREILCAAYNLKNADHPTTQDDKIFEVPHGVIIGLERHILETIGFDFRARYPQKALIKVIRRIFGATEGHEFLPLAYDMSIDMYKTFAPIKAPTSAMILAIIEVSALLSEQGIEKARSLVPEDYHTTRAAVMEVMLDLLDLYTQLAKHTKVGMKFELARFIDVKIRLNQQVEESTQIDRFQSRCDKCEEEEKVRYPLTPGSATSPATTGSWPPGSGSTKRLKTGPDSSQTMRFVYDMDEARKEREKVEEFTKEEFEEHEVEVEEPLPQSEGRSHHDTEHTRHPTSRHGYQGNNYDPYHGRDKARRPKGRAPY